MYGFSDKKIIAALVTVLVTSYAAFFAWVVASINRLSGKIDSLVIAVARLEGAMWGRTPPDQRKAEGG